MFANLCVLAGCLTIVFAAEEADNIVTKPPSFTAQPPQILPYRLGEKAVLTCHAEGEPPPTYTWKKNRIDYNPGEQENRAFITKNSGTLNILNTKDLDEGDYQCTATNGFGSAVSEKVFLRKAILNPFPAREQPYVYTVNEGDPLTVLCTPPTSFPQGTYYWSYKDTSNVNMAIKYDSRVVIDLEGRLHFANVKRSDSAETYICISENDYLRTLAMDEDTKIRVQEGKLRFSNVLRKDELDGAIYSCGVHNLVLRKAALGFKSKIIVRKVSGNIPQRSIKLMWASGSSTIVGRVGTTTEMQCIFSGYPTPNVKWEWTNKDRNRYSTRMHNTILTIRNTSMEDAGQISCSASNANTDKVVRQNFNLAVQSKPFWKRKPQNVNAAEEEDATFYCEADAFPRAKIEWFINGVPIASAPPNPRRQYENNRIVYRNLLKADVGVLQCNASNPHGWVYANAFLNVLADPPSITKKLPEEMKFPDGKTVKIPCNVFGAPKPIISWSKDGRELTGGRFVPQEDGSLEIQKIQATDAGKYECLATNKFGEARDRVTVFVRRPTRIKVPPAATTVIRGSEAKFTCEAETDPLETVVISWRKDGQDINYGSTQRISRNTWDNSILISGTDALDTGVYTCVATNGLDTDTASAELTVRAEPSPPTDVAVHECNSRSAIIRWKAGAFNNAPIFNFIIEFNTTFSPWQVAKDNVSSALTEDEVPLSPWGKYKFRVRARNAIGLSLESEPSPGICETDSAKPDKNPSNVRTLDERSDALVIAWSPMPPIEQNGPNMYYSVEFQRLDIPNAQPNTTRIEDPRVDRLVHTKDVSTYVPYKITVKAINGQGSATETAQPIIGFSGEGYPTQVISDFRVDSETIKGSEATFMWSGVDESDNATNGFFMGYRVTFWKQSEPQNRRHQMIYKRDKSTETDAYARFLKSDRKKRALGVTEEHTVVNLPSYTNIQVYVTVMNKNYAGKPSNTITLMTKQGVPGPPVELKTIEVGPNHVIIGWTPPPQPNGDIKGYDIEYQKVTKMTQDTRQQRQPQINNPTATQAKVWNLESQKKYTIYLAAFTSVGRGDETFIQVTTDAPGAPGKPTMKIVGVYPTSINVTWTPSTGKGYKPASAFYIQYRKTEATEWQRTPFESDLYWGNVTNLDPGYTYEVRVVASNGDKYEAFSDSETVKIEDVREVGGAVTNVAGASWFIALMIIIAVFVLILIIVCFIRQNRGEKYPVIENELLRGQPHQEHQNFGEFTRPEEPYRKSQISLNSDLKPGIESDNDSMAAYDDDPSKFNEDGSFIGQYGAKKSPPPDYDKKAESAMSTFV